MSFIDGLAHRVRVLWAGEGYAGEQEREMRFHLELEAMAAGGADPMAVDGDVLARRNFGNVTYYREETRRMTTLRLTDRLRQDLTYTLRGLGRSPGFAVTITLILAVGVGINGAMFSLFDALFLRMPPAVSAPDQLRRLYIEIHRAGTGEASYTYDDFRYPQYRAVALANRDVPIAAAGEPDSASFQLASGDAPVWQSEVTGNYFSVLQTRPQIGRFFSADEDLIGTPAFVAVISDALWLERFHRSNAVIGQHVRINRRPFVVVGVAPKEFRGIDLEPVDVWVPLNTHVPVFMGSPGPWYTTFASNMRAIARVPSPSMDRQLAGAATNAFRSVHIPRYEFDPTANITTGSIIANRGPARTSDEISVAKRVAAMSFLVLLIACANVANLFMLRVASRRREIAVRRALGAAARRVLEGIALESLVLAAAAGAASLLIAFWAGSAFRSLVMPRTHWGATVVDAKSAAFSMALTVVVSLAASVAPALQGLRVDLIGSLRAGSRNVSYQASHIRGSLLAFQTALCVVLLVGAGLFLRSLSNVETIAVGYDADHIVLVNPEFGDGPFAHRADLVRTVPIVAGELARVPGVTTVAYAAAGPMYGVTFAPLFLPGRDSLPSFRGQMPPVLNSVSPGFFQAAGVRVRQGRVFDARDGATAPSVAIVNETMARGYWPGEQPIGKCLIVEKRDNPCTTVVGVAQDTHVRNIIEGPRMMYFRPIAQSAAQPRAIVLRTEGTVRSLALVADRAFRRLLPAGDGATTIPMSKVFEREVGPWRLGAILFSAFAVLAMVVAGIGVYSVVAYSASQRANEMAIRIALGARTADILDHVVAGVAGFVGVGILIGLGVSFAGGRLLSAFLFGVTATDASVLITAVVALIILAIVACLKPGLGAARVDPATAFRSE